MSGPDPRGDRGSASVLLAAGMAISLALTLGVTDLGRVLAARSAARAAADAGALAAAQELAIPTGADPASVAAAYVVANGAVLVSCVCPAGSAEAVVEAAVQVGDLWLVPGAPTVIQRARAVVDLPA